MGVTKRKGLENFVLFAIAFLPFLVSSIVLLVMIMACMLSIELYDAMYGRSALYQLALGLHPNSVVVMESHSGRGIIGLA